ncbi:MAG: peptide chain release factor-like protein [Opitutaceae bacterium]|nr:peptide chain release factor-like protein [Opitutaceae bacterium]
MKHSKTLNEAHLEEEFSLASGPGGQHVNKVSTKVTLYHRPSGLRVSVQSSRSQAMNRKLARARLMELIQDEKDRQFKEARSKREKRRRQTARRPRMIKEQILKEKRKRSETKQLRTRITE